MDSAGKSAAEVARELGTTIPRVVRTVDQLGFEARVGGSNRLALTAEMVELIERELGAIPSVPGLSRTEVRALAALREAPFGVASARTLARRAGMSPTSASKALQTLRQKGLAESKSMMIASGRAKRADVWSVDRLGPGWSRVASGLADVRFPDRGTRTDDEVPARLRHLFWDSAPEQLEVSRHGGYIARRLITTMDPEGLAWGARNLRRGDWRAAVETRGLDARTRALAKNLAEQAHEPR